MRREGLCLSFSSAEITGTEPDGVSNLRQLPALNLLVFFKPSRNI